MMRALSAIKRVGAVPAALAAALLLAFAPPRAAASDELAAAAIWHDAGQFSFSDQLGGFRILSVSGTGTQADPIVIEQEFFGPGPGTIAIRNHGRATGGAAFLQLFVVTKVRNGAPGVWVGFDIELQEELRTPSDYWDGLSFNQTQRIDTAGFRSSRFRDGERIAEPHDRVRFLNGHVNVGTHVEFRFVITDVTPKPVFYLLQEPVMLFS